MSRPFVTLSYTQTLDGRLATRSGHSQWIGSGESVRYAHQLRAQNAGIMVGVGTVLYDNPRLTVRHVAGRDPLRVIVDSRLRTPLDAAVLAEGAASGTLLAITEHAPADRRTAVAALGATVVELPGDAAGRVVLPALLAELHRRGIFTLMVEGGAALITALLRDRLVDRVAVCVAPRIMGAGREAIGDLGIDTLDALINLTDVQVHHFGVDLVIDGRVLYSTDE